MSNRRQFLGGLMSTASVVAAGQTPASRILGANDRVRFGLIGAGSRGKEIFGFALQCPNVEAVAVADVYTRRLDEAKAIAPDIKAYRDFRQLLDDKSIDAVFIATPQHQHCPELRARHPAGKDVYQEKTMAFTPDSRQAHAEGASTGSGRVVQIGMQMNSGPGIRRSASSATEDSMGTITAHPGPSFPQLALRRLDARRFRPDCDAEHVDWNGFPGRGHVATPFDPQRYMNWRFFWDYSGGNVFENMVHQVGFWYKVLGSTSPRR